MFSIPPVISSNKKSIIPYPLTKIGSVEEILKIISFFSLPFLS